MTKGVPHDPERPRYIEYEKPVEGERGWCCYKDDPCATHAHVLNQLVRMACGKVEADPELLTQGLLNI